MVCTGYQTTGDELVLRGGPVQQVHRLVGLSEGRARSIWPGELSEPTLILSIRPGIP